MMQVNATPEPKWSEQTVLQMDGSNIILIRRQSYQ